MTNQTLVQLVNQMAENAAKNPYIVRALETLKYRNFPALQTKLRQEGKEVIPTVVTLAFVLEKITSAMKHNWRFLKLCNKIWSKYDNLPKIAAIYSTQGLFKIAKVLSVEEVTKRVLQYFETKHLPKEMASNMEYFFSLHARNRYYIIYIHKFIYFHLYFHLLTISSGFN